MVNKAQNRDKIVEAPQLDESWWQAILHEEERYTTSTLQHNLNSTGDGEAIPEQPTNLSVPIIDWDLVNRLYELDETISLQVTGYNRGGLLVCGDGLHGFVPVSHLVDCTEEGSKHEPKLEKFIDRYLNLKIIECDQIRSRIVLSERAAQSEPGRRNELLQSLEVGDQVFGKVTNITHFGVFVDLGGVEGLIHVSEISWGRVRHPADMVSVGQEIEIYVVQVDRERARIALSLKRLHPNPWLTIHTCYQPGQIVNAVVTSIVPFGAFARLENGLDGLIHISEMGMDGEALDPLEILQVGEEIRVRILHIDRKKQRLGLSLNLNPS